MTILSVLNMIIDRRLRQSTLLTRTGIVKSVSEANRTCVVTIDDIDYPDVLLQGSMTLTKGLVQIPKVGSQVKVSFQSQTSAFVSVFGELTKILIDVDLVKFNGGALYGMVKIDSNVTKLNNLENKVNDLINAYNAHIHPGVTSGSSSTSVNTSLITGTLTATQRSDLENTKITQ